MPPFSGRFSSYIRKGDMDLITFKEKGKINTEETLRLALDKAEELGTAIVTSSNTGSTAEALMKLRRERNSSVPIVIVTAVYGMKEPGKNQFPEEKRKELEAEGAIFVTAAHALSGAERAFSNRFQGQGPIEIMAHTLRMLSQGVKVGVECSTMALDAGVIEYGNPVVAVGGTGMGADTAIVLTPAYTHCILDTKIHEILCKPY